MLLLILPLIVALSLILLLQVAADPCFRLPTIVYSSLGSPTFAGGRVGIPNSEFRIPNFHWVAGREIRQEYCLHTTLSCVIVPLPLPIGGGVFFAAQNEAGVERLLA